MQGEPPNQPPAGPLHLDDPVTRRMQHDFTRLPGTCTVGTALDWLRRHPPPGRIIYFYVVDDAGRLEGVVPTRRLVLSPPETPLADIMVRKVVVIPAHATVLDACEFFIQHRLLAFPVIDDDRRLLGVVDIELYTDVLTQPPDAAGVRLLVGPLMRFLHVQSASGVVLLAATLIALVLTNSPWAHGFTELWHVPVGLAVGGWALDQSLHWWINDGLMTVFFFVAGLEIKRELVAGELSDRRKAALPVVAALGGMVMPAVVYLACQWGQSTAVGWSIPTATDIAFVIGFLALLGRRVPGSLKILLLSLAIADDLGAVLLIALVYSGAPSLPWVATAAAGFAGVLLARRLGVRRIGVYFLLGVFIWYAFVRAGVHPTVAGVLLGLLTPARPWLGDRVPLDVATDMLRRLTRVREGVGLAAPEAVSPLERLEHGLHPWVAFGIMPVFALANAGVVVSAADIATPVALAVALGLAVGKPAGIYLASRLAVALGLAHLPVGITWRVLLGAGSLAGIGFTMSLFIAGLALPGRALDEAKLGILIGSALSAALGSLLLYLWLPPVALEPPRE